MHLPDIDIDFANRDEILRILTYTAARLPNGRRHNTGVYVTDIPTDGFQRIASIDYKTAEQRGYFKFDFLNVSIYGNIESEEEIQELIGIEPMWDLLEYEEFANQLFHVGNHHEILKKMKPKSIEQLAAVLAIIRPAKRYLQDSDWEKIFKEVWIAPSDGKYHFKRSHSFGYSLAIVVQMNKIVKDLQTSNQSA